MIGKKKTAKKTEREKVEERREEVLARGRKFKYPLQYAKHKLVFNTIIIVAVALGVAVTLGWALLYKWQDTGDVMYRITRILPIAVANVDGEGVRYSDYLMIYKSTLTPVEQQQGKLGDDEDSEAMRRHYKRSALNEAEDYAYALKMARELGVEVTNEMINKAIEEQRKAGGTERSMESFTKILADNFGLSMDEYRRMIYLSLVKVEVAKKIDKNAEELAKWVEAKIAAGADLMKIAEEAGGKVMYEETGGLVDRMNVDGGRATMALTLEPGQISKRFVSSSGDGYYYVKLVAKTDSEVNYESIKVPFTELDKQMKDVRDGKKVTEYIEISEETK